MTFYFEGKRYESKGKTAKEAHAKAAKKKLDLEQGKATSGGNMSMENWAWQWLETFKANAIGEGHYRNYSSLIRSIIVPAIGNKRLNAVTAVELQRLVNSKTGYSKSHLMKLRQALKSMFHKAYRLRMITYDPAEDIDLPKAEDGTHRSITQKERADILALSETHRAGLWVMTLLYCGLRPSETRALDWDHIDFERKVIHIGYAMKAATKTIDEPKTKAGVRDVPIPRVLVERLLAARGNSGDPVFTQVKTGRRHTIASMYGLWNNFKRELDISIGAKLYRNQIIESKVASDLVAYCLRHTYGTDLQEAGVPLNVAKYLMGHSDISVTANVYTHTTEQMLGTVAAQIDEYHGENH
ncbi:MAG: site-specific integrase [Oscillospiraceae bacterium]|nr:site-specific integrase [Oscillospiraceae bacterium]